jgi:hypothetical protein
VVVDHFLRLLKVLVNRGDLVRGGLKRTTARIGARTYTTDVLSICRHPVDGLHLLLEHLDVVARAEERLESLARRFRGLDSRGLPAGAVSRPCVYAPSWEAPHPSWTRRERNPISLPSRPISANT